MTRIVILGIAGGGKSTLARRLSTSLGLPLYQMDKIAWLPGWQMAGDAHVNAFHADVLENERWIIDGYGSWDSIERRCDVADTLILIDQPAWRHYWWAYKRNIKLLFRPNADLPNGCSKWPLWKMMFRVVRSTRKSALPRLHKLLQDRPTKKRFVLSSPREIRQFCREHARGS